MMRRLWGEGFFDPAMMKWTSKNTGSATCKRGMTLLEVMIAHLPSPTTAQKDSVKNLHGGPLDEQYALLPNAVILMAL
ncbi:hypothetical protein VNO77_19430 [Canavalia gladiata]|uniref:Uncharacterized protein n=1 Tax=Canavalia gladiata TaxID=3824 RepID=A0AAN9LSK1_CANGL